MQKQGRPQWGRMRGHGGRARQGRVWEERKNKLVKEKCKVKNDGRLEEREE